MIGANTIGVLEEVLDERTRQDDKWGEQNHPDGTGGPGRENRAFMERLRCERAFATGNGTWVAILDEEVAEALAESDQAKLREELIQVAAVAVSWIEAIDRRGRAEAGSTLSSDNDAGGGTR